MLRTLLEPTLHASRDVLTEFLLGTLPDDAATAVAAHLPDCDECEATVDELEGVSVSDTLISDLRAGDVPDEYAAEAGCGQLLTLIKEFGREPASAVAPANIREYRLLEKLGEGGMGAVYRALHTKLNKTVALKVLSPRRLKDAAAVERFEREMRAVGQLDHPHIVRATDAGEVDGAHFLVMELVDGVDLSRLLKRREKLVVPEACEIVRQAALALAEAHRHGMVHRDVKPSNLMLARSRDADQPPTVKLLDLGLARLDNASKAAGGEPETDDELTSEGQLMGTRNYMAPEQISDPHEVDARADVYSLGATLRKLLGGTDDSQANLPDGLAVVDRMLAQDPDHRFATAGQVADALGPFTRGANLAALLDHDSKSDSASRTGVSSANERRRATLLTAAAFEAIVVMAVVLLLAMNPAASGDPDRDVALWVLSEGNGVGIQIDGRRLAPKHAGELPEGPFRVQMLSFVRSKPDTPQEWESLRQLAGLRDFRIYNFATTDADAEQIAEFSRLTNLSISHVGSISDDGLRRLSQLSELSLLKLSSDKVTDAGLAHLKQLEKLRDFGLQTSWRARDLTEQGIRHIAGFPALTDLTLQTPFVTDDRLRLLSAAPRLRGLKLVNARVSGKGLAEAIRACKPLRVLNLWQPDFTAADLQHLAALPQVNYLSLSSMPRLGDEGLLALSHMKQLEILVIHHCPKITENGIAKLQQALPHCRIQRSKTE